VTKAARFGKAKAVKNRPTAYNSFFGLIREREIANSFFETF